MANQRNLKAFVRYDGSGRVVAGSLVLRRKKPKVGNWKEVPAYESGGSSGPSIVSIEAIVGFDVCMGMGSTQTFYYDESIQPLGVGTALYNDAELTQPATMEPMGYNSPSFGFRQILSTGFDPVGYNVEASVVTETICA